MMSPLPSAVCWGPRRTFIYNDALARLLRGAHPAAFARGLAEVAGVPAHTRLLHAVDEVSRTGVPVSVEDVAPAAPAADTVPAADAVRAADAVPLTFTACCSGIPGETGAIEGVFITLIETTAQLRAERRLAVATAAAHEESKRRVQALVEQQALLDVLPIGIGIAADRECRDIRVNRAFAATLGIPPTANASKTAPADERPTNFRVLTPDGEEIPDDQLPMQLAAREGREVRGIEFDIVHRDGRVVRLLEYAAPLFDDRGTPRGAIGAFVDITAGETAKRTLSRSEERYRRIFDTAGVPIFEEDFSDVRAELARLRSLGVGDLATYLSAHPEVVDECISRVRIIDVNAASVRMFGAPDKASLLASLTQVFQPETRQVFLGELLALARGDRLFEAEAALQTVDGRPIHAVVTVTFPPADDPSGSVLVSLTDISDRKRAETALRSSETLFREMADAAPVMLWITDTNGQCTFLSRSWFEFTGQTPDEGLGLGWTNALHPDDRAAATDVATAANTRHEAFRLEYRLRRHDGVYRWAIDAAHPRFAGSGAYLGHIGAVIDITDRKEAEEALEQEVSVRTTLAQVGASLAGELNADRLVQAVTDAATRVTGAEFGAFFHNVTDESGASYLLYSLAGAPREAFARFPNPRATDVFGPTFRGEGVIRLDDVTRDPRYGRNAPYHGMPEGHLPVRSYLAVPVIGRDGEVFGGLFFGHSRPGMFTPQHEQLASGVAAWAAIALDNARLYRDAEQANRLKDEFLATLSHELRTPLNAVLGWAHMLRQGVVAEPMRDRALASLERNARAQAQLVEDLLDVSRIVSGKLHLNVEPVELAAVIGNAVDTVRAGAAAKGVTLQARSAAGGLTVVGDPDRLQQVVWNLVSNAIKFTPAGGRVDVTLQQTDAGLAEIVVRDTGQGIAPSFQRHLFERFRQMDSTTARQHGGLGLGLSIVRHLTEAHGGTVSAESAGEGHGATFRVRLPLPSRDLATRRELSPPAARPLDALAGLRALVVDDEMDARELMQYLLESRGLEVLTAASTADALRLLHARPVDVLVADIGMPGEDGYALIGSLRASPRDELRQLPAIAVTAYASLRERDRALSAGFDGHLAKPVEVEQLLAALASIHRRPARP